MTSRRRWATLRYARLIAEVKRDNEISSAIANGESVSVGSGDVSNSYLTSTFTTNTNFQSVLANTNIAISDRIQIANATSYIDNEIASLVNSAPSTLDTLNELSSALNDDPNFATTITNTLASKANTSIVPTDVSDLTDTNSLLDGFSGSYDDLTNVPFEIDNNIPIIHYTETQPSISQIGELWFNPSTTKWYKSVENPNNATVNNTQATVTRIFAGVGDTDILPAPGGNQYIVRQAGVSKTRLNFISPLWIVSFSGNMRIRLQQIGYEDGTTHVFSGSGEESYSGSLFQSKRISYLVIGENSYSNNMTYNVVAAGAPIWEEIDSGFATENYVDNSISALGTTVSNSYLTSTFTSNATFQSYVANTNSRIVTLESSSSASSGGATQYANTSLLPKTGLTAGEFAFVGNTLFMTNGQGWYSVALINQSPSLSISVSDISLGGNGNTINFTYTATDPDGPTPTVTAELIGANTSQANVNLYTANSTVTVENLSVDGYSANILLTATDGIDQTFGTVTLSVSFGPDWSEQQKIKSTDIESGDYFGWKSAISGDTVIIGVQMEDTGGTSTGSAYIFDRTGTTWTQRSKFTGFNDADKFGSSVSIDGDTAIVGSPYFDAGVTDHGEAYIFTRSGSTWSQQARIEANDQAEYDRFGESVAISGDTAIVGAQWEDTSFYNASAAGAAYIFTRSGSTWSQQQKLEKSWPGAPQATDLFGSSVAIDGDTAVIGARGDDVSGAAYIFTRSGSSWSQQARLLPSNSSSGAEFGGSVSISGDTVVVGAWVDSSQKGSAYIYTRSGTTWTEQQKLEASDGDSSHRFGESVSISGNTVVVGAPDEDEVLSDSGAAYIFTRSGSTWTEQQKIESSDIEVNDKFGSSVAIDGDSLVVGARNENGEGAAYIFVNS